MGWGFRKSATVGGVRFTFSKSGVSSSVGGKGFRFTSGPRGVYVTTGFGGFYYRQRIGGGSQRHVAPRRAPEVAQPQFYATETFSSAGVDHLSDVTQDEFVSSLNEWTRRGALQIVTFIAAALAIAGAAAMKVAEPVLAEVAVYGVIVFLLARFIENRRRRFLLVYDLGATEAKRYQRLGEVLADLAASGRFRGVKMIGHHYDWKRNAGATRSLSFESASLRTSVPPHIITNLAPWTLEMQGMQLYFFPDRILIRSRGRFAALSYQALELESYTANFVWDESVPGDAQIVGQTWLYVRRDGGPDRRFNGNRQIPIVRTAYVSLKSSTGLEAVVQTTRVAAADQVARELRTYGRDAQGSPQTMTEIDPSLRAALSTFGLAAVPSLVEIKKAYRELAQRNHPDKFARAPRDLRVFAEQRMKETNAAYEVLVSNATAQSSAEEVSAGTPVPPIDIVPSVGAWRSPEAMAMGAAIVAIGVTSAGFRSLPVAEHPPRTPPVATRSVVEPPPPQAPIARKRIVITCPLRNEPSPNGQQLAVIKKSTELDLIESRAGWWRVRDGLGNEGWTGPKCWQPVALKPSVRPRSGQANSQGSNAVTSQGSGAPVDPYTDPVDANPATVPAATGSAGKKPEIVDPFSKGNQIVDPFVEGPRAP